METLKLVRLDWVSQERDKYVWEDFSHALMAMIIALIIIAYHLL